MLEINLSTRVSHFQDANLKFCVNFFFKSLKFIENNLKNVKKLKAFELSQLNTRFATPESTLKKPKYRVEKFKLRTFLKFEFF